MVIWLHPLQTTSEAPKTLPRLSCQAPTVFKMPVSPFDDLNRRLCAKPQLSFPQCRHCLDRLGTI